MGCHILDFLKDLCTGQQSMVCCTGDYRPVCRTFPRLGLPGIWDDESAHLSTWRETAQRAGSLAP